MRAVIFDFDGVIVDTEPLHLAALNEVLAERSVEQIPRELYYAEMLGYDDVGLFKVSYARAGKRLGPEDLRDLLAAKSRHYLGMVQQELPLVPGVSAFVESISRRCLLAVCSGALRHEIEFILAEACLVEHFGVIIAAEDVDRGKPDPQGYLLACARLQEIGRCDPPLRPVECLVVEDSVPGIAAAKAAGMKCLAVASSHSGPMLRQADKVVASLGQVNAEMLVRMFDC